jgi:hypothetical protein
MAMFLQQKDVESKCLAWIQTACMFMIGDVSARTADSLQDRRDVLAVLERQKDEWKPVLFSSFSPYTLSVLYLLLPGLQGW